MYKQQCYNKNLTKDNTNKVQKNVGMSQQCQNKISQSIIKRSAEKFRHDTTVLA